mgnify:CR=1 FL=1
MSGFNPSERISPMMPSPDSVTPGANKSSTGAHTSRSLIELSFEMMEARACERSERLTATATAKRSCIWRVGLVCGGWGEGTGEMIQGV